MGIVVLAVGPLNAPIAFVGEAPGADEARAGIPFIGPAGKLLDNLMRMVGILRSDSYITNVVKERPEDNNIKLFITFGKGTAAATPAFQAYQAELEAELLATECRVIVALGNVALWALLGLQGITSRRGSIYRWHDRLVVPTIHPAMVLYQDDKPGAARNSFGNYLYQYLILSDLKKALRYSKLEPPFRLPSEEVKTLIKPTFEQARKWLLAVADCDLISFDIEVQNQELSCFGIATDTDVAFCIPFTIAGKPYWTPPQEVELMLLLAAVLEDNRICKVMQNAVFDAHFMSNRYGIVARNVEDTMIAQKILMPDFPKGLGFITSLHTDMPFHKGMVKDALVEELEK